MAAGMKRARRGALGLLAAIGLGGAALAASYPETATVRRLPPPGTRVFLPDIGSGNAVVVDGRGLRQLATLAMGTFGTVGVSNDGGHVFTGATFYDRGDHGTRTDFVSIYDGRSLAREADVVLPMKRALSVNYRPYMVPSAHDRFILVQNATPASSVTVVDLAGHRVVGEIATAGCWGIYPSAREDGRFSTLCGDGTVATVGFDATGKEMSRTRSARLFDPAGDALFIDAERLGDDLVFVSFGGAIRRFRDDGRTMIEAEAAWPVQPPGAKDWRPGGYQILAVHAATATAFLLMHPAGHEGSHKDPSTEIWQLDLAKHRLVERHPIPGAVAVGISQGEAPILVVNRLVPPSPAIRLEAFDIGAGMVPLGALPVAAQFSTFALVR